MFRQLAALLLCLACGTVAAPAADLKEDLWEAAKKGDAAKVQALVEQGVDVNAKTPHGTTALGIAADDGHLAVVQILLRHKADMNVKDLQENTPLRQALSKRHTAVVKAMLAAGAEAPASALGMVVRAGDAELLQILLNQWKARPEIITQYLARPGPGPQQGDAQKVLIRALLEAGNEWSETAFTAAVRTGQVELVREVLAKAKPAQEILNKALAATFEDRQEVLKLLRDAGAQGTPVAVVRVDAKTLQSYAGTYVGEGGSGIEIALEDRTFGRKLGDRINPFQAIDPSTFHPVGNPARQFSFQTENGKVTALVVKMGEASATYRRVDAAAKTAPAPAPAIAPTKVVAEKPVTVAVPKNWPSFRGINASGVADEQMPPTAWDVATGIHIRWKTPIAGLGHSSPVVWNDRVFLTTAIPNDPNLKLQPGALDDLGPVKDSATHSWRVICLEKKTGNVLWERTAHEGLPQAKRHARATHANSTPATDGESLVVCFGSEGLFCYDFQGNLVWKQSLGVLDAGWAFDTNWRWDYGFASSPILYRGLVIVQCDMGKSPFLAAYDLKTGKQVWRTPREETPSHGTPTVYEGKDRAVLIANSSSNMRGYDPLTGKELWRLATPDGGEGVPTPITGHDLIFVTNGWSSGGPLFAIRPGATGDISLKDDQKANEFIAWSSTRDGPYMPTPIVYGDYLYCSSYRGLLTCLDARTGKQLYRERLGGSSSFAASPVAADGKLYFTQEDGAIRVVKAGPKFEILAVNPMGDACLATPAISDGFLFVRTLHDLIGIARPEPAKPAGGQ